MGSSRWWLQNKYLVGSADQIHVVFVEEFGDDFGAEGEADSSVVLAPAHRVLVGVGPQQIAEETLVGHVCRPHDSPDLLHALEIWTETAVTAEDLLVNDGRHREAVEAVCERLPQLDVVASLALVVEAVDAVDRGAFVVASQQEEVLGVFDLVGQQQADSLQRLLPSVHIVTQEQVVGLWGKSSVLKQAEEVVVLAVDVTANLERGLQLQEDGL